MCIVLETVLFFIVLLAVLFFFEQELLMKLLQQAPRQGASGSGWSGGPVPGMGKQNKLMNMMEIQLEAERVYKQQQRAQQQQRVRNIRTH